ncbi:MAG: hypothetical protein QXK89_10065 [Candidatus Bathyarchaeia archaeon]
MRWIRILRVFGFATIYFLIYAISAISFAIRSLSGSSQISIQCFLQDPLKTFFTAFAELSRSPILTLTLFAIIAQSLVLGFVTDLFLTTFLRRPRLRRHGAG